MNPFELTPQQLSSIGSFLEGDTLVERYAQFIADRCSQMDQFDKLSAYMDYYVENLADKLFYGFDVEIQSFDSFVNEATIKVSIHMGNVSMDYRGIYRWMYQKMNDHAA